MKKISLYLVGMLLFMASHAQAPEGLFGVRDRTPELVAFTNCTLYQTPERKLEKATLVIRDGRIEAVGVGITPPAGALVHDLEGKWVYPGFIDPWSDFGLEKKKGSGFSFGQPPQYKTKTEGPYSWNQAVKPEFRVAEAIEPNAKSVKKLRAAGFTTVHVVPQDGIFRGSSALVNLGDGDTHKDLIATEVRAGMSFNKGSSTQNYPSSLMGAIALIRQTLLDANWYDQNRDQLDRTDLSLEALAKQIEQKEPLFFEGRDYLDLFRANEIAKEFGREFIYLTQGDEYKRLGSLRKELGEAKLIVPLNFPKAFEVNNLEDAHAISLSQMRHWELAPSNAKSLSEADIDFAFTLKGLKSPGQFMSSLREAMKRGLSEEDALRALTLNPARFIGMEKEIGSLEKGKFANFIIASGNCFDKETELFETWVAGQRYEVKAIPGSDIRGMWELSVPDWQGKAAFNISGKFTSPSIKLQLPGDSTEHKGKLERNEGQIQLSFKLSEKTKYPGVHRFSGALDGKEMFGYYVAPNGEGQRIRWSAKWTDEVKEKEKKKDKEEEAFEQISTLTVPLAGYGQVEMPKAENVVFRNVTVWTNAKQGVIEGADVWIKDGKVQKVGKGIGFPSGAKIIDGTGHHLTPGIIDEHSHIAISRGVNEGTHNVTAEVSIADVVNPDDINIYRQLSGGVTTSQLLHGSANPIGGQSAIIKLRWGQHAEAMKFAEAPGFIKFALGENVKQSNWGEKFTSRYPQTRLGVEQVVRDAFQAARDQERRAASGDVMAKRRDLQLETLREILANERFITCHSYVQSELTMLMRLGEQVGFRVNTFTHVLEGYKIPEKLKAHGVNASTFSDWWAYKYEVIDAIPYNAAIMAKSGINTCINSDDAEMGRRLNQEAAKAVKYGGVSEEEALKMVTLNPAKALHLDEWVGSIEKGKHADLVLWNEHPLSQYAIAQMTFVDGRRYFDRANEKEKRAAIQKERVELIQKMLQDKSGGKRPAKGQGQPHYHCETLESDYTHE